MKKPQRNSRGAASASSPSSSSQRLNPLVFLFLVVALLLSIHYMIIPSFLVSVGKTITTGETDEYLNAQQNTTKTDQSLEEWRKRRVGKKTFDSWFDKEGFLEDNIDSSGPVLDFVIIGFPKCGTTAMMQTLGTVTTMPPDQDICTPPAQIVYYSYVNWAKMYGNGAHNHTEKKPLKGSKCPYYIEGPDLDTFGKKLPKTNLIVGFRHPVLWFQSFINMVRACVQAFWNGTTKSNHYSNSCSHNTSLSLLYFYTSIIPQLPPKPYNIPLQISIPYRFIPKQAWFHVGGGSMADFVRTDRLLETSKDNHKCIKRVGTCVARSRFHLSLARMGKTPLDLNERDLLRSEVYQAKRRRNDTSTHLKEYPIGNDPQKIGIPNKVFVFESTQGKNEYFYEELAKFVRIDRAQLPEINYRSGSGLNNNKKQIEQSEKETFDICLPEFDYVRKELLPIAYTLKEWLLRYLIPASLQRDDLVIPNVTHFAEIVESFGRDPCSDRLVRNKNDGEYYLAENSHYQSLAEKLGDGMD